MNDFFKTWGHIALGLFIVGMVALVFYGTFDIGRTHGYWNGYDEAKAKIERDFQSGRKIGFHEGYQSGYYDGKQKRGCDGKCCGGGCPCK